MCLRWAFIFWLCLPLLSFAADLQVGDIFPQFELLEGLSKEDYAYLGLTKGSVFTKGKRSLNEIAAELLFVEFLNKYCIVCQQDAPEFARFAREVEADPVLKGRVKVLGVAIGNSAKETAGFRKEYSVGFPIVADSDAAIYGGIGSPRGSPLVYILKRKSSQWVIVDGFKGVARHADMVMRARVDLDINTRNITKRALWREEPLKKPENDKVRKLLVNRMPGIRILRTLQFDNGDLFVLRKGAETLFAKAEARKVICAVCHDVAFIYVFDRRGMIRDFVPIYLTKAENRPFSGADVERIRKGLLGRNMLAPFRFEKEVDAVTSATLTSLIIYDSVHHGKELLAAVEKEGY